MSDPVEDEMMEDYIPLDCADPSLSKEQGNAQGNAPSAQTPKAHPNSPYPEPATLDEQQQQQQQCVCVCGRTFKASKDKRAHQKATGHGACVCGENFSDEAALHRHRYEAVHLVRCRCARVFGSTQLLLAHQRLERHDGFQDKKNGPWKVGAAESGTLDEVLCPCGGQMRDDAWRIAATAATATTTTATTTTTTTGNGSNGSETQEFPPLQCGACGRLFQDVYGPARDSYAPDTSVFACGNCGRAFRAWDAMWQHQLFSHHACIGCHTVFVSEARLVAHQRATGHCHCEACDTQFMTPDRLRQHLLETHGISRAALFRDVLAEERPLYGGGGSGSGSGAEGQREQQPPIFKGGFKAGANFLHVNLRCRACGQDFTSPKTLHDHRTRGWHDPFTSIACPFAVCDGNNNNNNNNSNANSHANNTSNNDRKLFPSISSLLHHLEHGTCASGIRAPILNALLRGDTVLESFILPQYALRPSPESPVPAHDPREINAIVASVVASSSSSSSSATATASTATATTTADGFNSPAGPNSPNDLEAPAYPCPFCPHSLHPHPSPAQLKAHLTHYNHTPPFLCYPRSLALPKAKSTRKSAGGFNAWSALAHSLETLLCAAGTGDDGDDDDGDDGGVKAALDGIAARLGALGALGMEGDRIVD